MLTWREYREIRKKYFNENRPDSKYNYRRYVKQNMYDECIEMNSICGVTTVSLAPLTTTTVSVPQEKTTRYCYGQWLLEQQQEGKTPMRYNDNYACASVTAPQSDAASQRDYLLSRLTTAEWAKKGELDKFFNRFVDNSPKTYKELIDAIKTDKFTLDTKITAKIDADEAAEDEDGCMYYMHGPFYGIVWSGPVFDQKAFKAGREAADKQATAAKDAIMTGTAAEGLAALQAYEAWLPAATAPTTATVQ